jgi:two-component system LytT family response regulator
MVGLGRAMSLAPTGSPPRLPAWVREAAFGFAYWLAFVVVLEPGNVLRALQDGAAVPVGQEILRLVGAALLGAAVTPAVFALTARFAIDGAARWRNAALHAAADAALATGLVLVSCVLAWALLAEERRPLWQGVREQLAADGLLLFFCLALLTAVAHALYFLRRLRDTPAAPAQPAAGYLSRVTVKARERMIVLELARVAWIESQGNYLALHADGAAHLIRETSAAFEAKLDPARFVRIHRRTIVAIDRVKKIAALPGGDATVTLDDGTELRMSRSYREAVKARVGT